MTETDARARDLAARMAAATDALNQQLKSAEEAIAALGLGVTARVHVPDGSRELYLAFGKVANQWRLHLVFGEGCNQVKSPLVTCSREVRVRAVYSLPALVEALVEKAESEVTQVEASAHAAQHFVEVVEASLAAKKER